MVTLMWPRKYDHLAADDDDDEEKVGRAENTCSRDITCSWVYLNQGREVHY